MSGSESEPVDSGSEDEPPEDNQGLPSAADDTALRDSIQALQEWTQAHLAQERKKTVCLSFQNKAWRDTFDRLQER